MQVYKNISYLFLRSAFVYVKLWNTIPYIEIVEHHSKIFLTPASHWCIKRELIEHYSKPFLELNLWNTDIPYTELVEHYEKY